MELLHSILLSIHIPFGTIGLILFWIPVGLKKGSALHRKVGWYYYIAMWVVLITSGLMSICNLFLGNHMTAIYLGYLTIITSYPLWYSYAILQQKREWSKNYFTIRKIFLSLLLVSGVGIILLAGIKYQFKGLGMLMLFFGLLVLPACRALFLTKAKAMSKEKKLKMHIRGTIISGIAAYTAFFAFGGSRILIEILELDQQWMLIPWILPSVLGISYSWYMKKKFKPNYS